MSERCRICGKEISIYDVIENNLASVTRFYNQPIEMNGIDITLYHCNECGHFQIKNEINELYYDNYKLIYNPEDNNYSGYPETLLNYYKGYFKKLYKLVAQHENLLDVGCGAGDLLALVLKDYKNCVGVEPSKELCMKAQKKGLKVINNYFNDLIKFDIKFDVITCCAVLEHIDDLNNFVRTICNNLNDDGIVMITVPNGQKIINIQSYCDIFPEHLNYFNIQSISRLLYRNGLELVSIEEGFGNDLYLILFARRINNISSLQSKKNYDKNKLLKLVKKYDTVGVFGVGVRSRNTLNMILEYKDNIKFLFDNNISYQGKYVPNIDVPINIPDHKKINLCDAIIITSVEYYDEIKFELENKYNFIGDIL
ncbi:MAG: class I SAM-dependent methyltransferase [Ruminococcus sp.]|nr:class I SAM-dependent methyltransferase [Ruminococcus sp.]